MFIEEKKIIKKIHKFIAERKEFESEYIGFELSSDIHKDACLMDTFALKTRRCISFTIFSIKPNLLHECHKLEKLLTLLENASYMCLLDRDIMLEYIARIAKTVYTIMTDDTILDASIETIKKHYNELGVLTSKLQNGYSREKEHRYMLSQEDMTRLSADYSAYKTRIVISGITHPNASIVLKNDDVHFVRKLESFLVFDVDTDEEVFFCQATRLYYSLVYDRFFLDGTHPHVNDAGVVCLGEAKHIVRNLVNEGDIISALDIVEDLLHNFVKDSAYFDPRGLECVSCGRMYSNEDGTTCCECDSNICCECAIPCDVCMDYYCYDCSIKCDFCGLRALCKKCAYICEDCHKIMCDQCFSEHKHCESALCTVV